MKKLVFVPILFFASFLLVLYIVVPNYSQSRALQKQVEAKQIELQEKQNYFVKIKEISDNLEKYQEFLDKIEKALPQEVSLASLLSFFQTQALANGLVMKNLSPQEAPQTSQTKAGGGGAGAGESDRESAKVPEEKIKETGFRLAVDGSFASLEDFLYAIEKSSRLIEVKSIAFKEGKVGAKEGEPVTFDFNLAVKVYSY